MRWSRGRRKGGGWLALFALTLQLALSFGHMHAEDFVRASHGLTVVTQAGSGAGAPRGVDHDHLGCATCATVHQAGTLLLPAPPAIALPADVIATRLSARHHDARQSARALAFRARGPPSA
jgi:hypothetical protein